MANCLVTGGAGFIGSHIVDGLIETGNKVTVLDNLSTGKKENLNPKARFIKGDIKNIQNMTDKFDYVFHTAALARIQPSIENPIPSHQVNVDGTLHVLEYCRYKKAKLIFSSSSSLYSDDLLPMSESGPFNPKNPYSMQKFICEQYIHLYNKLYGMDYCVLRYFNVFGERQILEGAYAAVVGIFLKQREERKPLTITGDGEQRRDFTYVKDVARANLMAMQWEDVVNIGSGKNYSVNELADAVGGEKTYLPKRVGEVEATLADIAVAEEFGWKPTVDIIEWINGQT